MSLNSIYDGDPSRYEKLRQCWLNERRAKFIAKRMQSWDLPAGASVLEIGSGTGQLLRKLAASFPAVQFFGLEPQPEYVEYSIARTTGPNVHFSCGKAEEAAALFNTRFSGVLSNDVLHHVDSVPAAIASVSEIAAPVSRWLAIEPNALNPYAFLGQSLKSGERNFWPRDYLRAARSSGWSIERQWYIFAIPPFVRTTPPPWMQKLELVLERIPFVGGGVYLEIKR
jgi:SAM-dependent methyltransferase